MPSIRIAVSGVCLLLAPPAQATGLVFADFLGGSGRDVAHAVAMDAAGNAYVAGYTESADFPVAGPPGLIYPVFGGFSDAFVVKLDPLGQVVYSTTLGGSGGDWATGIAVDAAGNAYVTGTTSSTDFPGAPGTAGFADAFVTRLRPDGTLDWSTRLGGSSNDQATGIAVEPGGRATVVGFTASRDFPTTPGAFQASAPPPGAGGGHGFVARLEPTGAVAYASYLAGDPAAPGAGYLASGVAVDAAGSAYLTGLAWASASGAGPVFRLGAVRPGGPASFVVKIDPAGSAVVFETYFGGPGRVVGELLLDDAGRPYASVARAIALGTWGYIYVTGMASAGFPTLDCVTRCADPGLDRDAFFLKLDATGFPVHSELIGGSGPDAGNAIAVLRTTDGDFVHIAGDTDSSDFPVLRGYAGLGAGDGFLFVSTEWGGEVTLLSTHVGGPVLDGARGVAVAEGGGITLAGWSDDFADPRSMFTNAQVGQGDAWVARLALFGALRLTPPPVAPLYVPPTASGATPFDFRIVFTAEYGALPGPIEVCIDGTCQPMASDIFQRGALGDGSTQNGEQYLRTVMVGPGRHTTFFRATAGGMTVRFPQLTDIPGPVVADVTPPVIRAPDVRLLTDRGQFFTLGFVQTTYVTALDDVDGAVPTFPVSVDGGRVVQVLHPGDHTIVWGAVDAAGNQARATQRVVINTPADVFGLPLPSGGTLSVSTAGGEALSGVGVGPIVPMVPGVTFGYGSLAFTVATTPGGTVTVILTITPSIPGPIDLFKSGTTSPAVRVSPLAWTRVDRPARRGQPASTVITLTLQDGGPYDQDHFANGVIVDPLAIGQALSRCRPDGDRDRNHERHRDHRGGKRPGRDDRDDCEDRR